ncbi:hypothetical protein F5Y13DRAFT_194087 [Hypoxylon sp. FL1857]|nr:hypothetical protein F5Y13DRAFT_194087 [Hypoxylon sp. FL1857]
MLVTLKLPNSSAAAALLSQFTNVGDTGKAVSNTHEPFSDAPDQDATDDDGDDDDDDVEDIVRSPKSFPRFERLPKELRDMIWDKAAHDLDRIISISIYRDLDDDMAVVYAPAPKLLFWDAREFPNAIGSTAGNRYLLWSLQVDELWWIVDKGQYHHRFRTTGEYIYDPMQMIPVQDDYDVFTKEELNGFEQKRERYEKRRERWLEYQMYVQDFEKDGRTQDAEMLEAWNLQGAWHSEDMDN